MISHDVTESPKFSKWITLGYSISISGWSWWLVLVIQILVIGQIFRVWVGPFLLQKISKRIQVRRVSLRSIRGIYVRLASMTIRIDRVGLSYHPSTEAARRFSFKVEGLWVEIHEPQVHQQATQRATNRLSRLPTLADFAPSPMALRLWSLYSEIYALLEPYIRPALRSFFVTSTRIVIRCLPALTQVVDFEMDRALVTFTTLPEAHLAVRGASLSTTVSFTNLESVVGSAADYPRPYRYRRFLSMTHLRTRFGRSVKHVWGRAWGGTQGSASVSMKIQNISGYANRVKWPHINVDSGFLQRNPCASQFTFVTHPSHNSDMCLQLPDTAELAVSFEVGQTKRIIRDHSIASSFKFTSVQLYTGPFQILLEAIADLRKHSDSPKNRTASSTKSAHLRSNGLAERRSQFCAISLLSSIEVTAKDICFVHTILSKDEGFMRRFTSHVRSLSLFLELGDPSKHTLHKNFLGSCPERDADLDMELLSYSFLTKEITVHRYSEADGMPPSRVVSIRSVSLQGFSTQWSLLNMPTSSVFPGDPNAALLVAKLNIVAPQLSERVDIVADIIESIRSQEPGIAMPREPRRTMRSVPRVHLDVAVDDVAACLIPLERNEIPASSLILSSTQCVISVSSYFRSFPLAGSNLSELQESHSSPLDVVFTVRSLLGPAFVMALPKPVSLDASPNDSGVHGNAGSIGGDPLLSLSTFEFDATVQTLGILDDITDEVILDVASTMVEMRCTTDAVSLELWQPSAVFSLGSVLSSIRLPTKQVSSNEAYLLKKLPSNIMAHFAIGHFGIILTGKDINPDEDLDLSRGIGVKSGIALQYCSMHNRQNLARLPKRFTHSHDRQRLYLSEDLLFDAIALSGVSSGDSSKFALFRCMLWDTVVRTSVATEFAADQEYEAIPESVELKPTEFLWARRSQINAALQCEQTKKIGSSMNEQLRFSVRIPSVQIHAELFDVYCLLLALSTFRSLARQIHRDDRSRDLRSISITLKATITTLQVKLKLFQEEQICFRMNGLNIRDTGSNSMSSEWGTLFAWVPSAHDKEKWEELIRLRSWKLLCNGLRHGQMSFTAIGEGARFRIPHGYIMADLILGVNLFFKCLKQLVRITSSGMFQPIPSPPAEDAKVTPAIKVEVGSLSLEASDDPLESKLGLIWRAGLEAVRSRLDREEAFEEKVAAIRAAEENRPNELGLGNRFSAQHTISIEEARDRLLLVNSLSWMTLHREYRDRQKRSELNVRKEVRGEHLHVPGVDIDPIVPVVQSSKAPPLLRFVTTHFNLNILPPNFPISELPDVLHDLGKGLPRDTQFTLLIPLHLHMSLGSTCVTLRDYPLPMLNIVQDSPANAEAWVIDTEFIIAEELGSELSVVWKECPIVQPGESNASSKPFVLSVPKTIMPVKTYANPIVNVSTSQLTEFCWCNSYAPALQDVMRIFDTLTTPPLDPSPPIGFWDKIRLVLHWRVEFNFNKNVHLNLKGSRDPYATEGIGAGFCFCWNGHTKITVGHANTDNELLQVRSDTMLIVIPEFQKRSSDEVIGGGISPRSARGPVSLNQGLEGRRDSFTKICAKFSSGIKWGIGIVLERACGKSCPNCRGTFACRLFDFLPHYEVKLRSKTCTPTENTSEDSFNRFRSNYIHFSTSLSSLIDQEHLSARHGSSKFHLTPKAFAHFWAWWALFDRNLSLPIRQGELFPNARPPSKKFGRHIATIKYRIAVQQLFISHQYVDETRAAWSEGVTHCVGLKGLVNSFEADMHQREQEGIVSRAGSNKLKKIRHKPFYAAEVKLTDLQLHAFLATFVDPAKSLAELHDIPEESKYENITTDEASPVLRDYWFDIDDFVETDWDPPTSTPRFYIFPVASCPRFTYFRRTGKQPHSSSVVESSRFGNEDTHVCLMGNEKSVHLLQADIVAKRLVELRERLRTLENLAKSENDPSDAERVRKSIRQLELHLAQLREAGAHDVPITPGTAGYAKYLMPSDISIPVDWTEFDNVYQAHCPKFSLCNSTRDILIQYYYCSRARRGLEYHMATRAVKYIRDQVKAFLQVSPDTEILKKTKKPATLAAQVAAQALKKIIIGDENDNTNYNSGMEVKNDRIEFDPMSGWSKDAVSQNKSHFCLLLRPQVVFRSVASKDSVLIVAALQANLQSHAILDLANIDDPISGRVMTRTFAVVSELQAFSPSATCSLRRDGVPLEVLLDLRAESSDFDRLVPQTNATFRYDKFNRLRLRNNVTSAFPASTDQLNSHLQHQTDLVQIHVPRFTVSASAKNFEDITNIITTLLLRSDSMHKLHSSKVETLLFSYDFTDLSAAADVVEGLQSRLRRAIEHERDLASMLADVDGQTRVELMKMKAHIFLLSEELNLIFDAINFAQEKVDDKHRDTKMALKVHATAEEISWRMVGAGSEMIAKLAIRGIKHNWLSRQDGTTVNNLVIVDLQAFDGSPDAEWQEILSKYREPSNHTLVKRGVFLEADWTVLAPVGGITIFEQFILELHPIRLQLEARVGRSLMEYVWPARRDRNRLRHSQQNSGSNASGADAFLHVDVDQPSAPHILRRQSMDTARSSQRQRHSTEEKRATLGLPSKRLTSSRSFTDLRGISRSNSMNSEASMSRDYIGFGRPRPESPSTDTDTRMTPVSSDFPSRSGLGDDAAEMKSRSAQKTFVLVRIASMHVLLSFHKDGSFFCRDARIHTRELQYRNQTWSFEELAEQFIPSDTSWRGWMRMALHQPLVPVFPVARELISKTKWITKKDKVARQARKITKPRPSGDAQKSSEQTQSSESLPLLSGPLKARKLRREKRSVDSTESQMEDDAEVHSS